MKTVLLMTVFTSLFVFGAQAPAQAMDPMKCDDATMKKMQTDMDAMTDPAMKMNKDMAMKQMEMAMTAMKDNKMDDCSMQMGMAQMSMTMKCDDASMTTMKTEIGAMKDEAMKSEAMKHMDMAQTSMKDSKADDCMMHMGEAMGAMQKKM